jgi:hypothetical protein
MESSNHPQLSWLMRTLTFFIALCATLGVLGAIYFTFVDGELFKVSTLAILAAVSAMAYVAWHITIRGIPPKFMESTMRKLYPEELYESRDVSKRK